MSRGAMPAAAIVLMCAILVGCGAPAAGPSSEPREPAPDLDALREEILDLHRAGIQAHLDAEIAFFTKDISNEYVTVGRGDIRRPRLDEIETMFSSYLGRTTFTKYEDLQDPIVEIADDGSIAWVIVQVGVEGTQQAADGSTGPLAFTSAWITLYRRDGDRWIRTGDVSTFR